MSIKILIDDLPQERSVDDDLEIIIENKFGLGAPKYVYPYRANGGYVYVPFSYGIKILREKPPKRETFHSLTPDIEFSGTLREEQNNVRKEALTILSKSNSIILSMPCGFGKTACAINLAVKIKLCTLVIVNKLVLIKQWKESLEKFIPGCSICVLTPKGIRKDCDFYLINASNAEKIGPEYLSRVGLVIVDEAHNIMAEMLARSMQYITPRYCIGLTATPYRPDGLDILLDMYFSPQKIIRTLHRPHTIYKVSTGFKPKVEKTRDGRVNWGSILDQQAMSPERNKLIIRIILDHPDRNFLILVKRIEQGNLLSDTLSQEGVSVTDLLGSNQEFDPDARVLVGTCQKVGVGFDHPKLNALLLASDIEEYFIQYLGRVFRSQEVEPIVFDLVDDNSILNKHFNTRKNTYKSVGGVIMPYTIPPEEQV
jgi:superfamily II DNA or RNA helicase